jgi:hypothetical protein
MARRRRIWTELLPPERLAAPETIALLERHGLEPLVALPPDRDTAEMDAALATLSRAGIRLGVWPLLSDREGYWPSEHNAVAFVARVEQVLDRLAGAGAEVATVAFDLEPPIEVTRGLVTPGRRWLIVRSAARSAFRPERRALRADAEARLLDLRHRLAARGIESLAAVYPTVLLDAPEPFGLWQRLLGTPVHAAGFDVVSPMLYSSVLRQGLPRRSAVLARGLIGPAARLARARYGDGASVSLGLVSSGKLGNEPCLDAPAALAADVAAARDAGVDDLALYALEGVLARGADDWLHAFTA